MKTGGMRRALVLAHTFNLLVALYFIVISIVSLVQLRWYHQLTISVKVRHIVTSATSYFAFLILIFAALVLIAIFVINAANLTGKTYVSPNQDAVNLTIGHNDASQTQPQHQTPTTTAKQRLEPGSGQVGASGFGASNNIGSNRQASFLVFGDSTGSSRSNSSLCCSTLLHLISSLSLIIILVVWLLNTGELVRDSISTQLESAFSKYQFANRSNHYSVAIDGMQDINNCCGSLDYQDFPHQRSGLTSGHYPGSCCGKYIFGVNARVICVPEEIVRAKQTAGCVTVLANFYDLISLLVVPVSLVCLFVNITIIAMITVSRGYSFKQTRGHLDRLPGAKMELKSLSTQ